MPDLGCELAANCLRNWLSSRAGSKLEVSVTLLSRESEASSGTKFEGVETGILLREENDAKSSNAFVTEFRRDSRYRRWINTIAMRNLRWG